LSATAIGELAEESPGAEGFLLLHWLRLGTAAIFAQDERERDAFVQAIEETPLLDSTWATGGEQNYPAHGILRRAAVVHAYRNRKKRALDILDILRRDMNPIARRQISLVLVQIAAEVEVAAMFFPIDALAALELLGASRHRRGGLLRTLEQTMEMINGKLPKIHSVLTRWSVQLQRLGSTEESPAAASRVLLSLTTLIDY